MEWKNKKVVLLRLENVLASFPKGKCKPQDVTDIRLEANILDALKTMPSGLSYCMMISNLFMKRKDSPW